jgi:phage recombination protein Bet
MELIMNALVKFDPKQIALIKNTVAKDTDIDEFNLFIEMCKARGLNPLTRQVYCFIFNKDNPKKPRQMTIVVSRDGQRAIAERTGNYRPDERAPRFELCEKNDNDNPAGLLSAEVSVFKYSHGEWFPVTEVAYWQEYAPVVDGGSEGFEWVETGEVWDDSGKPKKKKVAKGEKVRTLDPDKGNWRKMPRIMLAKCAEMAALRKAFPDDFGGLYGEGELDRGEVLDLTPSEMAEKSDRDDRMARIGGPNTLIIDWIDGKSLASVPADKFFGLAMDFIKGCEGQPSTVRTFRERNQASLRQYWGMKGDEALKLKAAMEEAEKQPEDGAQIDLEECIAKVAGNG